MPRLAFILSVLVLSSLSVRAQEAAPQAPPAPAPVKQYRVNAKEHYVEVDGVICFREGLLELVATVHGGKEHESLLRLNARPRDIHLALLMAGGKPGTPGKWLYQDDKVVPIDPQGSLVQLSLHWVEDGEKQQRSIGQMVRNGATGELMATDRFVFAGSQLIDPSPDDPPDAERRYAADFGGDVISLVSFPDEVLALPKAASDSNDQIFWEANTPQVPALGTAIVLRITCLIDSPENNTTEEAPPESNAPSKPNP